MSRKWLQIISVLALVCVLVVACGQPATPATETEEKIEQGNEGQDAETAEELASDEAATEEDEMAILRVGGVNSPDCMNPYACAEHWIWSHLIYEGFSGNGALCQAQPRMAKSMEVSEDGLTWTIELYKGIKTSDGEPYTAQSVVDFVNWLSGTEIAYWFYTTSYLESVEVVDELTLTWTTSEPIMNFPRYDAVWDYLLPAQVWGDMDDAKLLAFENGEPNGTGPYDLVEYAPGQHMIFDAKPDYYLGDLAVDRIVYQFYANYDAVIQALLAGEIDVTESFMPVQYYDSLANQADVEVSEQSSGPIHYLAFNMSETESKHPALDDPAVREAVDYAIDKSQILEIALLGHGLLCPTNWKCVDDVGWGLNPDLQVTPFDLEKAGQLLEDGGYTDTDGDGIRETPAGEPMEFRLYYDVELAPQQVIAESMQNTLGQIGIAVLLEAQESGTLWENVLGARDYDMALRYQPTDIDPAMMDFYWSCWAAEAGSAALNEPGYCNPEVDDLIYAYMTTVDSDEGIEYAFQAQSIFNQDRPLIYVVGEHQLEAYRTDRFDFPAEKENCFATPGVWNWPLILEVTTK